MTSLLPSVATPFMVLNKAVHVLPIKELPIENIVPIISHWGSLCINSPLVTELTSRSKVLTANYRSNDTIMKLVEEIVFNGNLLEILPLLYNSDDVVKMIRNDNYTVIASKYNTLKILNDRARIGKNYLTYHDWKYIPNEPVYLTMNTGSSYNGEEAILLTADATSVTIDTIHGKNIITDMFICNVEGINSNGKVPIVMPSYLYTFHKSQGLEFDNVAICIDDLFDFSMMYTGITRARKNVVFFTMNSMLYKDIEETIKEPIKYDSLKDIHTRCSTDNALRDSIQEILQKYINSGTLDLNAINNIYKDICDD